MSEHTGTGDPARSMALLWRTEEPAAPRGRGAAAGLSVDRVVRTAVALADAEGLAALSMRRVASELGVGAMTLYTWVPGKGELVDLMVDDVLGEVVDALGGLAAPAPPAGPDGWRDRLGAVARANWAVHERHPWLLQVATMGRPPLGPNVMAKYEVELRAVDGTGLDEVTMDAVVTLVDGFVAGAARGVLDRAQAERLTGISEEQWWAATAPYVDQVFDPAAYPTVARVGPVAGEANQAAYDPYRAFEFGLARLLDGIAVLVDAAPRA
ncbi:TetR/AcrR family transcriptional regulator [Cellulomonas fimi]|uniref:Tetracyclin repressor domain-containing protein n=1 Tax=Cellulomonas fimi (strain ATCC 484 / DSM 20113 / JCM 1341 / CCUG 24087 / LMG 16345 / NBRC 15513 / NCIMB 8980 / NCTC 7547 / NRS-133) TaxID=590998 RepID=F4H0F1_CELFA|nr:TetR/AcrR family transcriptional regulator C-terminal domain-containing protein [Cellulomonas fimi]AEE47320.1 Tetracyclin repressor domain-containing protein [Cellulomonas fimi ATCC 484]NNH05851.1 TetR/AcrR family transcriptional regulator [Cellulomonas fimi]VEH35912.1 Tetracycline repressor protein class E [Cellulomonas fimi]